MERIDGGPPVVQLFPRDPRRFEGGGPVHAVAVHRVEDPPHWHLVTYGLSELFVKESPDQDVSGWGIELTVRLGRDDRADTDPPAWASDLLANLAAYMWQTGHHFALGDHVDLRGPIRLDADTTTAVGPALRRQLNHDDATFRVIGDAGQVTFAVGEPAGRTVAGRSVNVQVPLGMVDDLAGLLTRTPGGAGLAGLAALPGIHFVVVA